ncbi:ABC-type transport auxiliary lipoprotein family protein [Acetobacter orientalis]|uniref:ABC-type transport auxiliary lipoprotein family protein n=1 Tax=Acetobacter orientalis TaxID=146474 RepID=UPI0020A11CCB|nr:ABC-type transport auxiliary lipoprotein family protein [Acetobacter orientalis]MCP1216158.1 ABC-type transport auxiliary lipoprotein family protein [Acetobacter orientalis]MCP1219047.1 ABC-type transport auxiliary lipoprotein family protein [Acetobacter orientalis]
MPAYGPKNQLEKTEIYDSSIPHLMTNALLNKHRSGMIADQPQADVATMRVQIDISRFDVATNGVATLAAT